MIIVPLYDKISYNKNMTKTIITNSEKETFEYAKTFAKSLKGGEVIGLVGNLGAGKTFFSKGLAAGLGVKQNVNSPTFVVMKVYKITNQNSKIKNLVHIDAYRLESAEDLEAIGATEYFGQEDTVTIIEWADKIKKILPEKTRLITISHYKDTSRKIE